MYEISVYGVSEAISSALGAVRKAREIAIISAGQLQIGFKNVKKAVFSPGRLTS